LVKKVGHFLFVLRATYCR